MIVCCLARFFWICEIYWKDRTAGHLVFWKPWPVTGHLATLFYIPNVNEFFEGLISLLQQRGDCVNENTDAGGGGEAEFLARRLEENKRTLRVMYDRVRSRPRTTAPESTYSGFGTFNTDINELQITITCNTKQWLSLWRQYRRVKYYAEFTVE